jgi:hypothetical protein
MTEHPAVMMITIPAEEPTVIVVCARNKTEPDAIRAALRWAFVNPEAVLRLKHVMEENEA